MTLFIVAIAVTLTLSFLCSMLEACLLSLSNLDIARMSEKWPLPAKIWKNYKTNIQKPLAVILIINTFAHTIGASVSGAQFNKLFGNHWLALFSIVFSLVMIQWAEILPKTLAVKYNKMVGGIIGIPFNLIVYLFHPVSVAIEWMNRPFEGNKRATIDSATSDIRVLARSAFLENLISKEQEKLIARSVFMSTLTAWDVMIDRSDINILSTSMSLHEGLIAAHLQRHTRFPLAENGDIDKIVGYVNFKDIVGALQVNPSDPSLRGIMRQVLFVRDTTNLPELLAKLTRGYQHIAIVQNSSGSTIGLVTLEDIIENLVGELQDEYDTPPDFIVQLSENRFRVGGSATFRQIKARAFHELERDDEITIDRWIKEDLRGKVPSENLVRNTGNFAVKVRRVVRGNVYDVTVERLAVQQKTVAV
jgi:putative hemolysin